MRLFHTWFLARTILVSWVAVAPVASLAALPPPSLGHSVRNAVASWLQGGGAGAGRMAVPQTTTITSTSDSIQQQQQQQQQTTLQIRKTVETDLSAVASFLATAAVSSNNSNNNIWQKKIDQLWAKSDIEALLRRRFNALHEGQKAVQRVNNMVDNSAYNNNNNNNGATTTTAPIVSSQQKLQLLWSSSDRLRQEIAMAAAETGEDTVWRRHPHMAVTPATAQWLNHLQMTATVVVGTKTTTTTPNDVTPSTAETVVVGFCEIAMLLNPVYSPPDQDTNNEWVIAVEEDNASSSSTSRTSTPRYDYYSPAIVNLAVAPEFRRQGIAAKLLATAERYVVQHWGSSSGSVVVRSGTTTPPAPSTTVTLGLYVHPSNAAAMALYQSRGYKHMVQVDACPNDRDNNNNNNMWYMSKSLRRTPSKLMNATPFESTEQQGTE
jgi:GNAT superfamily N-acetyltransferase